MAENPEDNADLKIQFDNIQAAYKSLQREFDNQCQELHNCRMKAKTAEAIENDFQEEIKILQDKGTHEINKLEIRILNLEEVNVNLKVSHNAAINSMEKELSDKDEEIQNLKRLLEEFGNITDSEPKQQDIYLEELNVLKEENEVLRLKIDEAENSCDEYCNKNIALQDKIILMKSDMEDLRECLDTKTKQLEENLTLIENMKEEILEVKNELVSLKSKPLDDKTKGNSLFAEVDDRRLTLEKNMAQMKKKYMEMHREHSVLVNQVSSLRIQNSTMIAKFKDEIEERNLDQDMELQAYKHQIDVLNELVESYKKELKTKTELPENSTFKQIEGLLNYKQQEIEELRQKARSRSMNETILAVDLATERRENRKLKLEISRLENEIGLLKLQIEELKAQGSKENKENSPQVEKKVVKSILKCDVQSEAGEEFVDIDRKVQFPADIPLEDSKPSIEKPKRRGAKVFVAKPAPLSTTNISPNNTN